MELNSKNKLLIGFGVASLLLLGKLFYIQIINDRYKRDADNNSMVYDDIYAPRGLIYDRNGSVLVGNRKCYDILVTPREVQKFDTLSLASDLDTTVEFIRSKMQYYRSHRRSIGHQTLVFLKQVPVQSYMKFVEEQFRYPGFKTATRTLRDYPFNAGGNLLGYISEVDQKYIEKHSGEYRTGDYAGKTGLEAAREKDLRGDNGYHILLRNARNQVKSSYKDGEYDRDAVPGKDIVTTIDAELQQYGQQLMQGKIGSIVAIEPATGEILSMVSSPGIDVNVLSDIGHYWGKLSQDPHRPMFNRTVMASYPPGSVFKLVNGLIGLQEGVLTPSRYYPCAGGYQYTSTRKLGCHGHRSPLNLEDAVMMSCNGYFCYVFKSILENPKYDSLSTAFRKWREYVMSFGFGKPLGSDFPSELGGNIPTDKFYNRHYGKGRWRFQTIISLSIGQGEIGATPLQIANLAAIMANRGYYYIPHLVKDSDSVRIDPKYHERQYTMVDTSQFNKVIGGMWKAVNAPAGSGNTARSACVPGLDICGKTGTAQNPHGEDNSVFICFAPRENPRIAVAAYVENAGFGATWACPIASLMVEKYLKGEISEERKDVEERILNTRLYKE